MGYLQEAGGKIKKGYDKYTGAIGDTITSLSGKAGMERYKPEEVGINESPFTDTTRSDAFQRELERQKAEVGQREFNFGVSTPQLGDAARMQAQQMSAAQFDRLPQREFRQGQQDLVAALQQQAAGQGPSLAGMQLDDARQQQIETAMALAASQRGLGAGQGLRSIAQQTQEAGQFAAREAARGRIAEQLAARQQLGSALQGARAQDIGIAGAEAELQQQASLANQAAMNQAAAQNQAAANQFALQQAGLTQQSNLSNQAAKMQFQAQQDALNQALTSQIGAVGTQQDQRMMDLARMQFMRDLEMEQLRAGAFGGQQQRVSNFLSGLAGAGGQMGAASMSAGASGGGGAAAGGAAAAASDINLKTNIKTSDKEIGSFLDAIGSHSYDYKDKKFGDGRYISPMAQELEKSDIGKSMVIDTPDGKMVDYARGSGTYLAAASMLNRRLKAIEKQLSKKGKAS